MLFFYRDTVNKLFSKLTRMKLILKSIFIVFCLFSCNRSKIQNLNVKKKIEEIFEKDQLIRNLKIEDVKYDTSKKYRDSVNFSSKLGVIKNVFELGELQDKYDSINKIKIDSIIKTDGYPGKSKVGKPRNNYVWHVMMHQDQETIANYLPIIKKNTEKGELEHKYYCQMLDRVLMNENKEQIYGTQGYGINLVDSLGKEMVTMFIWPIKDFKAVNRLRKEAGFAQTIEVYCKELLGIDFIEYNIEMVNELEKKSILNYHKQ